MLLHKRRRSGTYAEAWGVVLSEKLASEGASYLVNDVLGTIETICKAAEPFAPEYDAEKFMK